ncbi:unnamed protein product [Coffea canephora]|uniref:DH200=94 genomic scaffold, scaffold_67 n=1 Tax=Coffea canephora TaxID=49390 RepID=A0A068UY32_COFCA|nr:unnamed protein product [Coffea canephora]
MLAIEFTSSWRNAMKSKTRGRSNGNKSTPGGEQEAVLVGQPREWRRRKVGSEIIDCHCLETDWKRRRDFGGKRSKI